MHAELQQSLRDVSKVCTFVFLLTVIFADEQNLEILDVVSSSVLASPFEGHGTILVYPVLETCALCIAETVRQCAK